MIETLKPIAPKEIRYIKLGPGGSWEASCLDGDRIDWGAGGDMHDYAVAGNWDGAKAAYIDQGVLASTATGYVRELKDFYQLGADTLWITFARGQLWWAFAEPEVVFVGNDTQQQGSRYRRTIGPWRNTDINGQRLDMTDLSSTLTQLASYRRTICSVGAGDYLLRRINAQEEPAVVAARQARANLVAATAALICQLHWADFELLVDLIFQRSGWRRISALGGTMKDIDLLLEQPATGERASVQVKSSADQAVLDQCVAAFTDSTTASRFFFVCHSPKGVLNTTAAADRPIHLWTRDQLANSAVDHGLSSWLIERAG